MKLIRIEIKGFKSFADKTIVSFDNRITGIVGPNGCGKSNIIDAIRWVLGEQKTNQLRLEKMDNVLFNGCKTRKAMSLAEVSLTFENTKNILSTEFNEINITRKLYRSGDSEYRINNVICRLKDISNLFIDTGVGSNSYAIIELGMVDDILQNKENSRQRLFEQASSISKYKIRKKESLSKLKSTQENLQRLDDLLSEIQSNFRTLEMQSKRAERYKILKSEYKEISLSIIKLAIINYKKDYNKIYNLKKIEDDNCLEIDKNIVAKQTKLEALNLELLNKEKNLFENQKLMNELIKGLGLNENNLNLLKEQISNIINLNNQIEEQILGFNEESKLLKNRTHVIENDLFELNKKVENSKLIYNEKKEYLSSLEDNFLQNKNLLETEKNNLSELQSNIFLIDKNLSNSNNKIDLKSKNILDKKKQLENENKNQETVKIELLKLSKDIEELDETYTKLNDKETKNINEQGLLESKIVNIRSDLNTTSRIVDSKKNEYNLLKSMIDNLEGFPESIKYLKRNVKSFINKEILSDIIGCKDNHRSLIETAIASFTNFFVVDSLEQANDAVLQLSNSQSGKSGFFILNEINKLKNPKIDILDNAYSILEIINVEEKYKDLICKLFGNFYIVKENCDIDYLLTLNKDYCFIYESNNKLINSQYVYGGSKNLFDGSNIGRKKSIDSLQIEIETYSDKLSLLEKSLRNCLSEIDLIKDNSQKKEIDDLKFNIQNLKTQKNLKENLLIQLDTNIANITNNILIENNEIKSIQIESEHQNKDLKKQKELLNLLMKNNIKLNEEFESFSKQVNEEKSLLYKYESIYNVDKNSIDHKTSLLKENNQKLLFYSKKNEEHNKKIISNNIELKQKNESIQSLEKELLNSIEDKHKYTINIDKFEQEFYKSRNQKLEEENIIKELQISKNRILDIVKTYSDKIIEMRFEMSSIKERLNLEFSLDFDEFFKNDFQVEENQDNLEEKQKNLRKRIETFGDVNPLAIEAFNEVKIRFEFLQKQKEDILESKSNLIKTIDEIDQKAKDKFMESFVKVREHFINTFRVLFTEDDDCDLILADPSNPIESNIEIIAKPKGKKPLNINQLSGGEKTLTAIALLFSLYLLKPAPFCVFDEVDAPLDDNNLKKFNNIINKFSDNSQFIVVTHNKLTMTNVDMLYGVTMKEQGVSKLIQVKLNDLAND